MDSKYGLIIQRGKENAVNTFTQWGIACTNVPFKAGGKIKELPKRDWHDEHGEDTYFPKNLMMEAYDAEFEMACVVNGDKWELSPSLDKIDEFKKWLSGNDSEEGSGCELKIYSPYSTIGRERCYLLEISDEKPHLQFKYDKGNTYHENVVTFKVKFRVTDPMTYYNPTTSSTS